MSDYNLYAKGILNQFPTYSLSHATTGSLTIATATVTSGGAFVNSSGPSGSIFSAYKELWDRLNDGQVGLIPSLTMAEIGALTGIPDGVQVINITMGRLDVCIEGVFSSASGPIPDALSTYGSMLENNTSGSAMNTTTHRWITASLGHQPAGMTFSKDSTGDKFTVATGGMGTRHVSFGISFTNNGSKDTTASILIDGVKSIVSETVRGHNSQKRALAIGDSLWLSTGSVLTLEIVSETVTDIVKVYQCHVNFTDV